MVAHGVRTMKRRLLPPRPSIHRPIRAPVSPAYGPMLLFSANLAVKPLAFFNTSFAVVELAVVPFV